MISESSLFTPEVIGFKELIDQRLDQYTQFGSDCPQQLTEAIRYALLAPGKRIRPLLVLTATQVCGGNIEAAIPAACAVEMIHSYSLVHDDLPAMDDDDMRRGQPSCHVKFGEANAILVGDALIPLALEVIVRDIPQPEIAGRCVLELATAAGANGLVGGQAADLDNEFSEPDVETLEHIHRRKTGALLVVSLKMGGIVAQVSQEKLSALENFGKHLGLAFQIVDDLLDLSGEQAKMGKRTGKDAEHGKMTYPKVLGKAESEQRAREMTDKAIEALAPLGDAADPLKKIARFVLERSQ